MTVLFVRLLDPSVSGWKDVDMARCMLESLCNVHQKLETNWDSWLETMEEGRPFSQYQCSKNNPAMRGVRGATRYKTDIRSKTVSNSENAVEIFVEGKGAHCWCHQAGVERWWKASVLLW